MDLRRRVFDLRGTKSHEKPVNSGNLTLFHTLWVFRTLKKSSCSSNLQAVVKRIGNNIKLRYQRRFVSKLYKDVSNTPVYPSWYSLWKVVRPYEKKHSIAKQQWFTVCFIYSQSLISFIKNSHLDYRYCLKDFMWSHLHTNFHQNYQRSAPKIQIFPKSDCSIQIPNRISHSKHLNSISTNSANLSSNSE